VKAPERIETARLVLRRPVITDAELVYQRYASDPEVTRFLGWPRHQSLDDTRAFLELSEAEWDRAAELGDSEFTWNARGTWYREAEKDEDKEEKEDDSTT